MQPRILSLYNPMAHGYADLAMFKARTPYGASAVSGANPLPTEDELAVARFQGSRVANATKALRPS